MPLNILSSPEICYFDFKKLFQDLCLGGGKQPFPYFDMVISDDAFNEMEIQLSPCISPGNKIIFENLVEKYNKIFKFLLKPRIYTGDNNFLL